MISKNTYALQDLTLVNFISLAVMLLKGGLYTGHVFFGEMPPEMEEESAAVFAGYHQRYLFHVALVAP